MARQLTPKIDLEAILDRFDRKVVAQVDAATAAQIRAFVANACADLIVSTPAKRVAIVDQSIRAMLAEQNQTMKLVHLGTIEIGRARVLRDFAKRKDPEVLAMLEVLARDPLTYSAQDADIITAALQRIEK